MSRISDAEINPKFEELYQHLNVLDLPTGRFGTATWGTATYGAPKASRALWRAKERGWHPGVSGG